MVPSAKLGGLHPASRLSLRNSSVAIRESHQSSRRRKLGFCVVLYLSSLVHDRLNFRFWRSCQMEKIETFITTSQRLCILIGNVSTNWWPIINNNFIHSPDHFASIFIHFHVQMAHISHLCAAYSVRCPARTAPPPGVRPVALADHLTSQRELFGQTTQKKKEQMATTWVKWQIFFWIQKKCFAEKCGIYRSRNSLWGFTPSVSVAFVYYKDWFKRQKRMKRILNLFFVLDILQ